MNFIFESENGKLNVSNLKKLIKPDGSESGDYLTPAAADDFNRMVLAAKQDGVDIKSSQGYRDLGSEEEGCGKGFTQWCAWKKYKSGTGALAAKPGTSNHGLGLAVDISNCKKGGKVHNWLKDNAEKFKFYPFSRESWHWTYGFREGQKPQSTEVEKEPESTDSFIPEPIPDKETPEPSKPETKEPEPSKPETKEPDKKETDFDLGIKNLISPFSNLFKEEIRTLNNLIIETLQMVDDSGSSTFRSKPLKDDKYFILHHSVTKGDASGVVNILNKRGLGVQWVIDRDGVVHQTLGRGMKGAHVKSFGRSAPNDLSNSTTQGVEIVALDDSDILLKQCKSALLLVKLLGYPLNNVYGHGEVSTNKALNEGATCKAYLKKYWNTPEDKLPEVDSELSSKTSTETPSKETVSKDVKTDTKVTEPEKETSVKTTTPTQPDKKETDFDLGIKNLISPFSNLFNEEKSKKLNEEVNRMKQLF
jgi:outer membrane biosynthesis protein TonB